MDGIDIEFVAQCLGVDPKKYKYHSEKKRDSNEGDGEMNVSNPVLQTETEKSLKNRSIAELKIKCPHCQENQDFAGVMHEGKEISGMVCKNSACLKKFPEALVANRVNLFLKQLVSLYY